MAIYPGTEMQALYPFPEELIRSRMDEVLRTDNSSVNDIIKYLLASPGKMIRPRIVLLVASMSAHDPVIARDAAVAEELIHLASLIHDDVIDHANVRHGQESLNSRWGNHASVLAGDYLFATAFNLINLHGMQSIMENVTATIRVMCAGEIKQMSLSKDLQITEEQYLLKTYGKTACLFASCCKVGAITGNMPDKSASAVEEFGLCLGYAYQIIDDLLDFVGDSRQLGKPVGSDLAEGNITLPVIYALKDNSCRQCLYSLLNKEEHSQQDLDEIIKILVTSGAIQACLRTARGFIAKGLACLALLPNCAAIKDLEAIAAFVIRSFEKKAVNYDLIYPDGIAQ